MSEIALISARKSRLSTDARHGSKGAATAMKLAEDPDRFLSTIQIGITLIGILTGLYSGAAIADEVGAQLQQWGLQPRLAHTTGQILIVAAVTYLSIVVGELVPKRIESGGGQQRGQGCVAPNAPAVGGSDAAGVASVGIDRFLRKVAGSEEKRQQRDGRRDKILIQDGTDAGEVREVEQEIMERALILGDLRVSSIMTPKIDVGHFKHGHERGGDQAAACRGAPQLISSALSEGKARYMRSGVVETADSDHRQSRFQT